MANPLKAVENLKPNELAQLRALAESKSPTVVARETKLDISTVHRALAGETVHRLTAEVLRNHLAGASVSATPKIEM